MDELERLLAKRLGRIEMPVPVMVWTMVSGGGRVDQRDVHGILAMIGTRGALAYNDELVTGHDKIVVWPVEAVSHVAITGNAVRVHIGDGMVDFKVLTDVGWEVVRAVCFGEPL